MTEATGEIGFPGQPHNECLYDCQLAVDPSCRYFATTLYESTVTIIMPESDRTVPAPQPLRKIALRTTKDGKKRQTQDFFLHPHDYMNIRYYFAIAS